MRNIGCMLFRSFSILISVRGIRFLLYSIRYYMLTAVSIYAVWFKPNARLPIKIASPTSQGKSVDDRSDFYARARKHRYGFSRHLNDETFSQTFLLSYVFIVRAGLRTRGTRAGSALLTSLGRVSIRGACCGSSLAPQQNVYI